MTPFLLFAQWPDLPSSLHGQGEPLIRFPLPQIEASAPSGAQQAGKSYLLTHLKHASQSTE